MIGFYFCQSRKATNVDRWNRVIDWLNKNNKENRLIVLIGDANQNTLYDENSKQPTASATQSSSRIILNGIKSIFEVLNLKQILQPNAKKNYLDTCGTNSESCESFKITNVLSNNIEENHDCHRIRIFDGKQLSNFRDTQIPLIETEEKAVEFNFEDFSFVVVCCTSHYKENVTVHFKRGKKRSKHVILPMKISQQLEGKNIIIAANVKTKDKNGRLLHGIVLTCDNHVVILDKKYEIEDELKLCYDDTCEDRCELPTRSREDMQQILHKFSIKDNKLNFGDTPISINKLEVICGK